jgi:hypothetical protein
MEGLLRLRYVGMRPGNCVAANAAHNPNPLTRKCNTTPGHTEFERWYTYAIAAPSTKVGRNATGSKCAAAKINELNSTPVVHP